MHNYEACKKIYHYDGQAEHSANQSRISPGISWPPDYQQL